eukprot:295653-Rhodomonas_salina.1
MGGGRKEGSGREGFRDVWLDVHDAVEDAIRLFTPAVTTHASHSGCSRRQRAGRRVRDGSGRRPKHKQPHLLNLRAVGSTSVQGPLEAK